MGMYDTFEGEIECPLCGGEHNFNEQTKNYECNLDALRLGDYVDKGNSNYVYEFEDRCPILNENFKIGIVIRKGQIVDFITGAKLKTCDLDTILFYNNVEEGLGLKLEYAKHCKRGYGWERNCWEENGMELNLNPFPVGFKFEALLCEWEILAFLNTKKDFLGRDEFWYDIYTEKHGHRVMCLDESFKDIIRIMENDLEYRYAFK